MECPCLVGMPGEDSIYAGSEGGCGCGVDTLTLRIHCGHCAPCPAEIDIDTVSKLDNLTLTQGDIPETMRGHYKHRCF